MRKRGRKSKRKQETNANKRKRKSNRKKPQLGTSKAGRKPIIRKNAHFREKETGTARNREKCSNSDRRRKVAEPDELLTRKQLLEVLGEQLLLQCQPYPGPRVTDVRLHLRHRLHCSTYREKQGRGVRHESHTDTYGPLTKRFDQNSKGTGTPSPYKEQSRTQTW